MMIETRVLSLFILSIGAKEFAAEAVKMSTEFATHAGEVLQEKVPVVLDGECIE